MKKKNEKNKKTNKKKTFKEALDIQVTIECGFTLKRVRDMIITYSQMHCTYKYSQQSFGQFS